MANLDRIFKSRNITWMTKVHVVKTMVFPVVIYACECLGIIGLRRRFSLANRDSLGVWGVIFVE